MTPPDDYIPIKRPHFSLRSQKLFFLISKRSFLDLDEGGESLWRMIDGEITVGGLRLHFPDLDERLAQFWDLGIIEIVPGHFPDGRRTVLVIEPHMDDAALSLGGWMWERRNECEFTVLTMTGISNFTSYYRIDRDYFDTDTVSELRKAESATVMRLLGGKHVALDHADSPLRYPDGKWTLEWYKEHRRALSAFTNRSPTGEDLEEWTKSIAAVIGSTCAEEIWFPLGVGTSADHQLTRDACLRALQANDVLKQGKKIYLYQDVPYAMKYPGHTEQIIEALALAGGETVKITHDISNSLSEKYRFSSIFASQFKPAYMEPRIETCARLAFSSSGRLGEVFFQLKKIPQGIALEDLRYGKKSMDKLASKLKTWYPRNRSARRIRILCPLGVSCWSEEMPYLLDVFPEAEIEVHMTEDSIAVTREFNSPRLKAVPVDGLGLAWIMRILRVASVRPCPTIVITSARLERAEPFVRTAFLLASPLRTNTMDQLVQALRSELAANGAVG